MNTTNSPITDATERKQALDVHHSFIVQAPAGSGKTELLTQRYLALLVQVKNPEEIIAITFTRKAANEMRTRIIAALELAKIETPPIAAYKLQTWQLARAVLQHQANLQWNLLANPNRLRIQTIDALCASLTRQMPVLARFGAQPTILQNPEDIYSLAARDLLNSLEQNSDWQTALTTLLLHLDNNYANVEQLFIAMLAKRDQWITYLYEEENINALRNALEKNLQDCITPILSKISAAIANETLREICQLGTFAAQYVPTSKTDSQITRFKNSTHIPSQHYSDKDFWLAIAELVLTKENTWRKQVRVTEGFPPPSSSKNPIEKQQFQAMKNRMECLLKTLQENTTLQNLFADLRLSPPPAYSDAQWQVLLAFFKLLKILVAKLHLLFQQHAAVDYIEVAQNALLALGEADAPTDLALALDYKIQHILIDEFQDTSMLQFRLLERLTAGWQANDGRTLFLVGDPMQSIYRFRKAEVGLFLQARAFGIGSVYLKPLTLSVNFRSKKPLVDWFNQTFAQLLPKTADVAIGAVPHAASIPYDIAATYPASKAVNFYTVPDNDITAEANLVIDIIQHCLANDPTQKIGVLVRARTHIQNIIPQLQQAGIAYQAIELASLSESPVIQDLYALTRALLHYGDRIAWLAILRAPWCGLTLNDLHKIADSHHQTLIWERLQNYTTLSLSMDAQHRVAKLLLVLTPVLQRIRREPLAEVVANAWLALGGPACLAQATALNEAEQFFNLLKKIEQAGDIPDLTCLEKQLQKLYAKAANNQASVEIMTIHKAKGLEFDTVILPGLNHKPPPESEQLLLFLEQASLQNAIKLLIAPIKASREEQDSIYNYLRYEEKKRIEAETLRLLYVAVTRAKQALHLIGALNPEKDQPTSNSLLAKLWPIINSGFINTTLPSQQLVRDAAITLPNPVSAAPLKRLVSNWKLPEKLLNATQQSIAKDVQKYKFIMPAQQSNNLRQLGIIIHQILYQISQDGLEQWEQLPTTQINAYIEILLQRQGISAHNFAECIAVINRALTTTLQDVRGRWILNKEHQQAASEHALCQNSGDEFNTIIIDRTFVDQEDIRWIIDYKTTACTISDLNTFLQQERQLHQAQLENYAKIMQKYETRPIKLGLYFPLIAGWLEWSML